MRRKRLTKRARIKPALPPRRQKTGVSMWSRIVQAVSGAFDSFAKKLVAGVHGVSYRVAMLFPARSYRLQKRNAEVFAEKCAELVGGIIPVFLSVLINLAIIGSFATVILSPAIEPRTDAITTTLSKLFEEVPEVEEPAGNISPQSFPTGLAGASQAVTATIVHTPAMAVPITTTASSASNFQMSASATTTEASLVAERAATLASALADAQRSSMGGGGGGSGHQIGRMKVKANRLCVILDTSPSMVGVKNESLLTAQRIARSSGGEVHEHKGCAIRKGPVYPSDSTGDSFYDIVLKLIRSRNIDAIYWVCDLEDEQDPESIAELKKLLLDRRVRFYVSSYHYRPKEALMDLINATGGDFELKSPLDTE